MQLLSSLDHIKTVVGSLMGKSEIKAVGETNSPPKGVLLARYAARLGILIMALFIFVWWPVDSFDPEGFDAWSGRMDILPDEVWYVLLSVILSWGTTEVMAARAVRNAATTAGNTFIDDDFLDEASSAFDGRFANLDEGEEDFMMSTGPNPVIEEWRNNET